MVIVAPVFSGTAFFSYDDFIYITKMNNVVDGLAGKGIDSVRDQASAV